MELVRGEPLNEYVRTKKPAVRERLKLFCRICDAINYAHQRGVMHRDLKPSNILIDADGNPKILDFGLAKITDSDIAVTTVVTEIGRIQGTLPYMSPEQARGNPDEIDLRSDVYSLGMILYELLTGQLPYDVHRAVLHEAARVICEERPRRPSTLNRTLRGDVETIALKALEKEPPRRHQSAAALADDVERYLTDQPIQARPPSAMYQFRKLVARHKAPFAFVAALFLLVAGFGAWMRQLSARAESARMDRARLILESGRESDSAEAHVLYDDFFTRLRNGDATPEERRVFLSNAITSRVRTRRICAMDCPLYVSVDIGSKVDIRARGMVLRKDITCLLGGTQIAGDSGWAFAPRSEEGHRIRVFKADLASIIAVPNLPVELELKTLTDLTFYWVHEMPQDTPWRQWHPANGIWRDHRVAMEKILVLRSLPPNYPVALSAPEVATQVKDGFMLYLSVDDDWVEDDATLGLCYTNTSCVHLAGRLEFVNPTDGHVLGDMEFEVAPNLAEGASSYFLGKFDWAPDVLPLVRSGVLTALPVRLIPDRRVAYSVPGLEAYWGLPLECTAPVYLEAQ